MRQWHNVETSNNLADDSSRGFESKHQEKIKRWFPEIKKVHKKVNAFQVENGVLLRLQRLTWN